MSHLAPPDRDSVVTRTWRTGVAEHFKLRTLAHPTTHDMQFTKCPAPHWLAFRTTCAHLGALLRLGAATVRHAILSLYPRAAVVRHCTIYCACLLSSLRVRASAKIDVGRLEAESTKCSLRVRPCPRTPQQFRHTLQEPRAQ
ncbi:hypothetical protein NDU88_005721 [Pleurodeles waltl]|uniref:SWIM-type domain-containing protein n=1 Tax=Pleurodeles waltl TaxID=8319 RepID=A0AAV7LLX3_PLEWA|nr:hypothetical protein NDU88_005721 [Pleurodeles waltl]